MNLLTSPLLTDLYQLTMLHAYYAHRMGETAVFELFVRKLPPQRNFMMAAGLAQALEFLERLHFAPEELEWVEKCGKFPRGFSAHLARLRFTGDVHAAPEGTIFFPDEPVLRVTAPLPEAQLVESRLINLVHFETLVATKAARSVMVAPGKLLVDFGLRRAHGAEAGLLAARASYIAGYAGTATVTAAQHMDIPVFGTMAHSFVEAHDDEAAAFQCFAEACPQNVVLLIDTYDTELAARKVVELAPRLANRGIRVRGVRLDSGDLAALSKSVRRILDEGGLAEATIFASGNLDEYRIRDLIAARAPIDGFGIGTSLVTSSDAPYLDAVYKLQEYAGKPRRKRSTGKATWPGRKQVFRHYDGAGRFEHDVVSVEGDERQGKPLLVPVMRNGRRLHAPEGLQAIRERAAGQLVKLPEQLRALESAAIPYCVEIAPALRKLAGQVDRAASEVPALCK
jgi:nicotinate phosphoribosyltransferase